MDHPVDHLEETGYVTPEASASEVSEGEGPETAPRQKGTHLPQELNLRHQEIIRLAFSGIDSTRIAEQVGMAVQTVRMILRSPLAQAEIARLAEKAEDSVTNVPMRVRLLNELTRAGTDAVRINGELMRNPEIDPKVRAGIGRHFMDRIVFGKLDDEREGSYREILRGLDSIERKLDPNVIMVQPGQVQGGNGAASPPPPEATIG